MVHTDDAVLSSQLSELRSANIFLQQENKALREKNEQIERCFNGLRSEYRQADDTLKVIFGAPRNEIREVRARKWRMRPQMQPQ